MKKLIACFLAVLLLACSGQKTGKNNAASVDDSSMVSPANSVEKTFIGVADSAFTGKWISKQASDSVSVTLNRDGSAFSEGMPQSYLGWKQIMANVIVLTRPGIYGGTVTDTAYIDIMAHPMTLKTKGAHPLSLVQQ